ncbi:PREDICTED: uncharacterized protein LOC105949729 [Erythranthe guttata]|uniref:uncharacterized protein LOC105949729 n=1 Tax=Erythranthe guttata TaxID=4155 RepID=UPI00064DF340|nr:PREDICTED: uncharacterized protein LOC105949729 [Erythranthe guttata]|eukprot:XP_012828502.1 PREDICTED: uncharacterized protein LOC105949729 [Erythranthe guttata]
MQIEIDALERNGTWKARVEVRGDTQVAGIDYDETFAPIAKLVSVRTFLAITVIEGWEIHQLDENNAFLHGDLREEVYMRLQPNFSSSHPNKFLQVPRQEHLDVVYCVLRYLNGSPGQGILFRSDSSLQLYAFCDADWAACPKTLRSLTVYYVQLGTSHISWKTKKQPTVARSSAEAEYRAMAMTTCSSVGQHV